MLTLNNLNLYKKENKLKKLKLKLLKKNVSIFYALKHFSLYKYMFFFESLNSNLLLKYIYLNDFGKLYVMKNICYLINYEFLNLLNKGLKLVLFNNNLKNFFKFILFIGINLNIISLFGLIEDNILSLFNIKYLYKVLSLYNFNKKLIYIVLLKFIKNKFFLLGLNIRKIKYLFLKQIVFILKKKNGNH